ncbi:LOW QUALITY PROTEIN: WD repeat-containing protein 97 [Hippopotamus amphibius kiboko]|uniref:LOW QUALITY PROTEIN: WD repeat-containing protein 97 n=1 Tax=Hippopotamus amphibius kiboko TaxID=575201 RepID=UPI0025974815|nr:LOW QUALITY PROTEIN: WD repeat-containing protein 97 [Hippopotamus amphibius kiboko]
MESEALDASKPFTVQGDHLIPDLGLCDADIYAAPGPPLLKEEHESSFSEPAPRLFTSNSRWQNMTPSARARQLWLLLRAGLQTFVEKEKRAELRAARLTHGLEPLRRLEVAAGLCSVAQDPVGGRFVVLDGAGRLHLYREDGWAQGQLLAPVALTGLVAVPGPLGAGGRFVGWGPAGLAILRADLSPLWLSKPGERGVPGRTPLCCLPVPDSGLLLVAEAGGSLALWKFRSGGRCLVPHGSPLLPPPSLSGALARLALGPLPPHHVPRCFAACGSAVLTFDLHTWALVDVRRDLHKTTISDLAYCREAEAVVTASRDSTVKVWEAGWQIRMVFVGHTGAVTAVAVLPNTALVLSASQDGTLRTWDLQAGAQVGEVALRRWGRDEQGDAVSRLLAPAGPGWPALSLRARSLELWRLRELYSPLAQLSARVLHLQVAPALPAPTAAPAPLPTRLVCACADGSVYLVSVSSGRAVSALLLEPEDCASAVAYCLPREALWLLTRAGHLLCANAARCPMRVLRRLCPPPPPAPRPCCLHLYSHLTDPRGALANWEMVRQCKGELGRGDVAWAWKDKNRYLPVVGHTDGTLSVLELRSAKTVFRTEAHGPGPVTAIASTWNSIVSSGGDLTVKMWRVFPYAEESLSLLRTFSCCQPAAVLCALGKRVTVGFEDPNSATYGLVQFGLGSSPRYDHRPQDDPTDHITGEGAGQRGSPGRQMAAAPDPESWPPGLCCCPALKLFACSSLDCTLRVWTVENRLLRLLQLNGAPQALTFCSNSGDLVLALGSRLCLVAPQLYLPTSYLVKNLCQDVPDAVDDPPLPLTSQESLTSAQLQRLASLRGVASLRSAGRLRAWPPTPESPSQPLPCPTGMPPSVPPVPLPVCSTALFVIHGPSAAPQQPVLEEDVEALVARDQDLQQLRWGLVGPAAQPPPSWQQRQEAFDNYLRLIYGPGLLLLARSSLSCELGLGLDLQLQWELLRREKPVTPDPPSSHLQRRIPLLLKRRPQELLSNLRGFFPATVQPCKYGRRPIHFPGCVPNSAVLQQMWLPGEVSGLGLGARVQRRSSSKARGGAGRGVVCGDAIGHGLALPLAVGQEPGRPVAAAGHQAAPRQVAAEPDPVVGGIGGGAGSGLGLGFPESLWAALSSENLIPKPTGSRENTAGAKTGLHCTQFHYGRSLWEERCGHLPRFLHFFVSQNWFKKLFPIFTLQAYPEVGTVEGLASLFVDLLDEASWADRVHILHALLRLLPDVSSDLCSRLQGILLRLLNLDQPPSLQDWLQRQFVMLALQLLLACSLESREVVLELMSYFLYSPASCRPELKKLLDGLGLQDPQGFLFKEMMTWVQGPDLDSKAALRRRCCQKLEEMIQQLQVQHVLAQMRFGRSRRALSETLTHFRPSLEAHSRSSAPAAPPDGPLPLERTDWSRSKMLDLGPIDALNVFCRRQRRPGQEPPESPPPAPPPQGPRVVPPRPRDPRHDSLLRLREASVQRSPVNLGAKVSRSCWPPGRMLHRLWVDRTLDGAIRRLKLPLPRVELQPFPPDWPRPARPRPPRLLQPALQRYFLPDDTDPDSYS